MPVTSAALQQDESALQAELRQLREALPPAPAGLREQALAEFVRLGFPTVRLEDWRYTSLREIAEGGFSADGDGSPIAAATGAKMDAALADAPGMAFVDGRLYAAAPAIPGVELCPLTEAGADALAAMNAVGEISRSSLVALNTAFFRSGALLRVADDTIVEQPIHLLYASTPSHSPRANHVRTVIEVGRNSRVTVIEHFLGLGDATGWTNAVTDILLADGATLSHYKVQREAIGAYHTADISALQGADSNWHSVSIALGAHLCRNDIRSRLAAAGARCSFDGLYMAGDEQHVDHHTMVDHAAPRCTSEELYKGVLGGRAAGVFNGKVLVRNDAQRTDARQLNKNLLLSDAATIDTKPQLEIFADDVKCSHGATTGRLSDDAVFFLRARGLDETAARNLLTYAFANEIVERIATEPLRDRLEAIVRDRLAAIVAAGRSR
jgi:Fe-S cluster assembly protein SufD